MLTDTVQIPHPTIFPVSSERRKAEEEGGINVFGAEKYFNMKLDGDAPRIIDTNVEKYDGPKSRLIGTPSVSSEASWNSQIALLPNPSMKRNSSQIRRQKVNERWSFFSGFACNGSCSDKNSVYVDRNNITHSTHRDTHRWKEVIRKETIRAANSPISLQGRKLQTSQSRFQVKDDFRDPTIQKIIEDDPRKSLDVFGSHMIKKEDITQNLERKLSVLTWDAIPPKAPNMLATSASSERYEDIESDGSSDLFEIENISGSAKEPIIFTKQTSDGMSSSCMTRLSPWYAPSETSIEWSVVTASAADFSAENTTNSGSTSTPRRSRGSNGLLGCKSHKAVDVAETVYKRNEKAKSHLRQFPRPNASIPVRKLQAEKMTMKDYDFP